MVWPFKKQQAPPPVTAEVAQCDHDPISKLNADLTIEYVRSIYLWRAIDMIGQMSASVPLKVMKENEESQLRAPQLAVEKLLKRPNPQWTGHALQYYIAVSLAVANKAYLLRVRGAGDVTQELWPIATRNVTPIINVWSGLIEKFQVQVGGQIKIYPVDSDGDSDLIYLRRPALNEQTDRAPAVIAAAPAEVFTRVLQRCADIVSNSSNITGLLSTESEIASKAVEAIKDKINQFKTGHTQSGGTLVTANAKWNLTRLSEDPASALSVEIKDSLARDVVMTFGVPTQLVGLPGQDTYNNMAMARVGFLTDTVLPGYIGLYVAGLNHALMKNGAHIEPDLEHIPAMVAGRQAMIEMAAKASMLSINEQRALLGYPKFEDENDEYADADVPVKLEELRLKRLAIEAQMGGVTNLLGRDPT
jgi:phage portal protein BeeE